MTYFTLVAEPFTSKKDTAVPVNNNHREINKITVCYKQFFGIEKKFTYVCPPLNG
jgi:hypothetical protein